MGRLIDADDLINYISEAWDNKSIANIILKTAFIKIVNSQPTAYDVNKVVEQLNNRRLDMKQEQFFNPNHTHEAIQELKITDDVLYWAIEIVKKGGIE